jgi:hypothetical protein
LLFTTLIDLLWFSKEQNQAFRSNINIVVGWMMDGFTTTNLEERWNQQKLLSLPLMHHKF